MSFMGLIQYQPGDDDGATMLVDFDQYEFL